MYILYLIALIPVVIGLIIFLTNDKVNWIEWLSSSAIAFITTIIMHCLFINGMTKDVEYWSGSITKAIHYPSWVEEYEEAHTREVDDGDTTDSDGNVTHHSHTETYYTTEHETHYEHWTCISDYGTRKSEVSINVNKYNEIVKNFGGGVDDIGTQCYSHNGTRDSGDDKYYVTKNKTKFMYATHELFEFENKVKASPSTFSFINVPTNIPVFSYPNSDNIWQSNRLLGRAKIDFNISEIDKLNSRLGSKKQVNVIIIGFDNLDESIVEYQKAKFVGGKKNDLVICYGYIGNKLNWVNVFGWTESEIVKENIRSIMLKTPFSDVIPLIEKEIIINYKLVDWHKFDYLKIELRLLHYMILIIVIAITQTAFLTWCLINEYNKNNINVFSKYRY